MSVRTTCPYCGVGCGVLAQPDGAGGARIEGDPAHPANAGRLCSKGSALGATLSLEDRLLTPRVRGQDCDWDTALAEVAAGLSRTVAHHGPDAVAFYVSGQMLTEDYYVANKLLKGFIGTANIDTNSRLCMSSSVAGHVRAFGSDTVPNSYADLELAELVVLVGSNAAWCHPIVYQRLRARREAGDAFTLVVIDPRRTASCDLADLHLPLDPGSDVALWNGLLVHLHEAGLADGAFLATHTGGAGAALTAARAACPDVAATARATGLTPARVARFFELFAGCERTLTLYSQGVNQSSAGTDKVNAILNAHLLTGRIGKPGCGPFSLTGQPNAMGGREVGGLANQLAAHMTFDDPHHLELVREFWGSDALATRPGLKAVDLFEAVHDGRIQALWIMCTNPAVSLPDTGRVREALERCPLVIVSDCTADTDTARHAHILLPALTWGEKDGTVTNSERRISRQRAFLPAAGQARADWRIVAQVAQRMGYGAAFAYQSAADVFREHAALSTFRNFGQRDFDLGPLADLGDAGYDALEPVQWPVQPDGSGTERLFAQGGFYTPDRRARLVPVTPRPPAHALSGRYPWVLNTGRLRDQWHTMTRTGKTARLLSHRSEPELEVHPGDCARIGLEDGALAEIESPWGRAVLRVRADPDARPGAVFAPIHWSAANTSAGGIGAVVNPATDPVSGEPEFKHTPVAVRPYQADWHGFVLLRQPPPTRGFEWWVRARHDGGWRLEFAGRGAQPDWRALLGGDAPGVAWVAYADPEVGAQRLARLRDGRLEGCVFVGPTPFLLSRDWLARMLDAPAVDPAQRRSLLAGRPGQGEDTGAVVCACHQVGVATLTAAIASQQLTTVAQIGAALGAGTGCGSCVPELRALLAARAA